VINPSNGAAMFAPPITKAQSKMVESTTLARAQFRSVGEQGKARLSTEKAIPDSAQSHSGTDRNQQPASNSPREAIRDFGKIPIFAPDEQEAQSLQQGTPTNAAPQPIGNPDGALQHQDAVAAELDIPNPREEIAIRAEYTGPAAPAYGLRNKILTSIGKNIKSYIEYRDAITQATPAEKQFALNNRELLLELRNTLDWVSFARCVEAMGRRAPTFSELRKDATVSEAIKAAWTASDPGTRRGPVTHPHEEGGWIYMNLIDGSLSTLRAPSIGESSINLNLPEDVENSVVVAVFHTHPNLGPNWQSSPSHNDKALATDTEGVPDLVAGTPGTKPDIFDIFLAGPAARTHLASDRKFPGRSGGIAP
jgi:hypothetical protein